MASDEAKNEAHVMVLGDLSAICHKLAGNSNLPKMLRDQAGAFVEEFNSLVPYLGHGDARVHFQAESLLIRITRFLPEILEREVWPADLSHADEPLP